MLQQPLTRIGPTALALVLGVTLAGPGAASPTRDASVGSEGELYLIREGAYGELFPEQGLADPGNSALALDVTRPDGTSQRLLVPGTETAHVEDSHSILFEDESHTLFLLWQSKVNFIHYQLNLIGLRDGEWSDPIEISGNPFGWKSSPQLSVTRDSFRTQEEDGSLRTWTRTVVHLLWWEEGSAGEPLAHYSPVTLIDGTYTGWNPVYQLDELLSGTLGPATELPTSSVLAEAAKIETGRNAQSVTLGFVSPSRGELISVVFDLLPGEITFIADRIRAQIDELGRDLMPDQPVVLADRIRAQIDELGNRLGLHPGWNSFLASKAHGEILAADPDEPVAVLADRIRAQIDELGARLTDLGVDRLATRDTQVVLDLPTNDSWSAAPGHQMRLLVTSVRPVPVTGSQGVALHLSPDGREALVAWQEGNLVHYRESRGDGWSQARTLHLGDDLDLSQARQILEQRADERATDLQ